MFFLLCTNFTFENCTGADNSKKEDVKALQEFEMFHFVCTQHSNAARMSRDGH